MLVVRVDQVSEGLSEAEAAAATRLALASRCTLLHIASLYSTLLHFARSQLYSIILALAALCRRRSIIYRAQKTLDKQDDNSNERSSPST